MSSRAAGSFLAVALQLLCGPSGAEALRLEVAPIRQAKERCGPAALAMVLRYHGAGDRGAAEAEAAWNPAFRGALITDLAAAARRAGYRAEVTRADEDSLVSWLRAGLPPILLYHRGVGAVSRGHYAVLSGWDPDRRRATILDGGSRAKSVAWSSVRDRWRSAGALALVVRPGPP